MLRLLTSLILICLPFVASAETCPTIAQIKAHKLNGWKLYDIDTGKALSANRESFFNANIDKFVLAEFVNMKDHNGAIRCYYHDKDGSSLEAYLSKTGVIPKSDDYWYPVTGFMRCAVDANKCIFNQAAPATFAQK